jgi:nucleotide-binding universal stress UspA family protein
MMNTRDILFPTDFSHDNDAALRLASTLAAESGAVLHIVHVDDMRDIGAAMADSGYPYTLSSELEDRTDVMEQLVQVVPPVAEVMYQHHYLKGAPIAEIVGFAERENVDLIVMASHGRTGLARLLMGSIAEGVLRKAPCPVLVVKQPAGAAERTSHAASEPARA